MEGDAIVNRFPYDDRLLTMDEVVSKLASPSIMPPESVGPDTYSMEKCGVQRRNLMWILRLHWLSQYQRRHWRWHRLSYPNGLVLLQFLTRESKCGHTDLLMNQTLVLVLLLFMMIAQQFFEA
jgi:hypothetical protein